MVLRLEWTPSISVNNEKIDAQHKRLFSIINKLIIIKKEKTESDKIFEVLRELIDYSGKHFQTESQYMSENNFPRLLLKAHIDEHEDYVGKMEKFVENYGKGRETLSDEILKFLADWWLKHVSESDMKYKGHVNS
jgi:hemerythrin